MRSLLLGNRGRSLRCEKRDPERVGSSTSENETAGLNSADLRDVVISPRSDQRGDYVGNVYPQPDGKLNRNGLLDAAKAAATAAKVELWKRATSLGGVESLIEHRASVEGPDSPCPPDLLRLSVGLEDPDDLYDDLDRALHSAHGSAA